MAALDSTVVVGCYERFLFGFRAEETSGDGGEDSLPRLDRCFTYAAHQASVKCLTTVGHFVASGGSDDLIHVYDLNSGADLGFLMHPGYGSVTCIDSFTPDDSDTPTHIFGGSEDGVVNVWEAGGAWDHLKGMTGHKGAVAALAVHPSGRVAISTGADSGLRLWDLAKGKTSYCTMLGARGEGVAWASGGEAYAVLMNGKLNVRSVVGEGALLACLEGPRKQLCVSSTPAGSLFSGAEDGSLSFWDLSTGAAALQVSRAHSQRIRGVAALPGAGTSSQGLPNLTATASTDGMVKVWDIRKLTDSKGGPSPLAEASTTARLTCICASESAGRLKEMAAAQAQADKSREAEKQRRVSGRVKTKAGSLPSSAKSTAPSKDAFEVVPAADQPDSSKKAKKKSTGLPTTASGVQLSGGVRKTGGKAAQGKQPQPNKKGKKGKK